MSTGLKIKVKAQGETAKKLAAALGGLATLKKSTPKNFDYKG